MKYEYIYIITFGILWVINSFFWYKFGWYKGIQLGVRVGVASRKPKWKK